MPSTDILSSQHHPLDLMYESSRRMSAAHGGDDTDSSKRSVTPPEECNPKDKVQLPSISTTFEDLRPAASRNYALSSYTFPPSSSASSDDQRSQRNSYESSGSHFDSPLNSDVRTPYSENADNHSWNASGIVRPSSTPGSSGVKYEDSLRHASFSSAPMSQAPQLYAGSARISGQKQGIKSEWAYGNQDFVLPQPIAPPAAATRSPPSMAASTLVDRPQRKRGKLPKETTDYLKTWLHRHSDHPYPSEDEKKQLCHATGLSMSQVSNWMINARRRILAPAHRSNSGPTTTSPFPPAARSSSLNGLLDPVARRASMPGGDGLQLYHPMTLQSVPSYAPSSTRHMLSSMPPRSQHIGGEYSHSSRHMGSLYPPPNNHNSSYMSSDVPLSAPPSLSNNPFSSHHSHHHHHSSGPQNVYPSLLPSPRSSSNQSQYFDHPTSTAGSGYGTPP